MILNKVIINGLEAANWIFGKNSAERPSGPGALPGTVRHLHFTLPQFTFSEVIETFGSSYFLDVLHKIKSRD